MHCSIPTDIYFSFAGFSARGGRPDEHRDGREIAFFEELGCRTFLDVKAEIADIVCHDPIDSTHVMAHMRKATQGEIALENFHPFQRKLLGLYWVFAHNAPDFDPPQTGFYRTDSERAFCLILNTLRATFPDGKHALKCLHPVLRAITHTVNIRQAPFATASLTDEDITIDFQELAKPSDRVAIIATTPLADNKPWIPIQPG